ncbi:MAG: DUF5615 family PIN-like protein [Dehalococcoidia bacterium]|nr:DUF5615 family PIN-like protein [Dehalococcoidia bacterium]
MTLSLYLDEDFARGDRAGALRAAGFDVLIPREAGLLGATDEAQLMFATAEIRLLVSHNFADFPRIHTEVMARGEHHAGICMVRQGAAFSAADIVRGLAALSELFQDTGTADHLLFLSNFVDRA